MKYDPRLLDKPNYPVVRVLETMFSDMDIHKHVNNVAIARFFEAVLDCGSPAIEVVSQAFVDAMLFFRNLQREASDWTTICAASCDKVATIKVENTEDALDRIRDLRKDRLNNHRHQGTDIQIEDREKQLLFGLEKVVKASGISLGAVKDFR